MKLTHTALVVLLFAVRSISAQPVILDFRNSHSEEDLLKSGLKVKEEVIVLKNYNFENQNIKLLLPNNRILLQYVKVGQFTVNNGEVFSCTLNGGIMPFDQAFQSAINFHQSFNLKTSDLITWANKYRDNTINLETYAAPNGTSYPAVGICIDPSCNPLYPCVIRCEIDWYWPPQNGWDEARAWRELPTLSPVSGIVSLNPPSGMVYDSADAYKKYAVAAPAFAALLNKMTSNPVSPPNWPDPYHLKQRTTSYFWLIVIGVIALILGVFAWLKLRKK